MSMYFIFIFFLLIFFYKNLAAQPLAFPDIRGYYRLGIVTGQTTPVIGIVIKIHPVIYKTNNKITFLPYFEPGNIYRPGDDIRFVFKNEHNILKQNILLSKRHLSEQAINNLYS